MTFWHTSLSKAVSVTVCLTKTRRKESSLLRKWRWLKLTGRSVGPTKAGKGSKVMLLTDTEGVPMGVTVSSASPHEVRLIESLLETACYQIGNSKRLVCDRAADSSELKQSLKDKGLQLICPPINRTKQKPRKMSKRDRVHYKHRWKIERTFGWLKHFRRLTTRWEYLPELHLAFWQVAAMFTILRGL